MQSYNVHKLCERRNEGLNIDVFGNKIEIYRFVKRILDIRDINP